ncbi:MAG: hypothetical protein HRU04_08985 [Oceanospirillaceae bacterium]|nr:hypothetical protein [Oceanospirillaceae bacterium]
MNYKSQLVKKISRRVGNLWRDLNSTTIRMQERNLILQGQALASQNSGRKEINDLSSVEFSVYSQWGEDGIIDWLVSRLPEIKPVFVEFGVENYREANTRFLLQNRNWRGCVYDGSKNNIEDVRGQNIYWKHNLNAKEAFIDRDNINDLLIEGVGAGEIGLLSIDIDGNDYWVWEAINIIDPAIVVIEYNALFGDTQLLTVPYRKDFLRGKAHFSNLYFGASINALIFLGKKKGYTFVGSCSAGVNAFFVRDNLMAQFEGAIKSTVCYPSAFREERNVNGELTYRSGVERLSVLNHLSIVDVENCQETKLNSLSDLYSMDWMSGIGRVV